MSRITILCVALLSVIAPGAARAASAPTIFRIFLTDGSALVSYGEYARVNDHVVFSMPVGGDTDDPRLQVVSVPAASVDWTRTDRYADSARYQQYVSTRGSQDFEALSTEVAGVLNEIVQSKDRQEALAKAEQVRKTLLDWPRAHYGYRQDDVRDIVALLDNSIAALRGTSTGGAFEVSLFSTVPAIPHEPVDGMPTPRQELDALFHLVPMTPRASDRVALLESALALLNDGRTGYKPLEVEALRRHTTRAIQNELDVDTAYSQLARRLMTEATKAAQDARVSDVERIVSGLDREDEKLGRLRPDSVDALRASLQTKLTAARRLRLLRDQWHLRQASYRQYEDLVGSQLLQLVKSEPLLESIRHLEGPPLDALRTLRARLSGGAERLQRIQMPDDLKDEHGLLVNAWRFAENAANLRFDAVASGNLNQAWQASSSAAAALLMITKTQQALQALLEPPHLQ
jgi:hypothetical protein